MTHPADADTTSGRRAAPTAAHRRRFVGPTVAGAALAAVALTLAACGSSSPTTATTATTAASSTGAGASSSTTAAPATVKSATSAKFGAILVNSAGMALYTYGPNDGGTVNKCLGECLTAWPAVTVPAGTTPTLGSGLTGTLATAKQSDGTTFVTYNGQLLYTFVSDTSAGQVTGNGVAGFSVAKASSSATPAASGGAGVTNNDTTATTKAPTTTAASGGGYQY